MDVLIVGAGATGLLAARELSRSGINVTILEARNRTGGRICTVQDSLFDLPVETGAEFIHGNLGTTLQLLKEAKLEHYAITGDVWNSEKGQLRKQEDFIEDQEEVIKKLKALGQDMSVSSFLYTYFSDDKYTRLRKSLIKFVQGYDAADADHASAFALLQELVAQDSDNFRLKGGYVKLVDHLTEQCRQQGCNIHLSAVAASIEWSRGKVNVTCTDNRSFTAHKVIITLPIGVLQAKPGESGYVRIDPLPATHQGAIEGLGFSGVIKAVMQFDESFWSERAQDLGFLFADTAFPTWWTQLPEKNGMITGWMAGPAASEKKDLPKDELLQQALNSLAQIFSVDVPLLKQKLVAWHITNWTIDPFTKGAYAYEKVTSIHAKRVLNTPVENTLFFAGEALCEGPERGTVEGAFISALEVVKKTAPQSEAV